MNVRLRRHLIAILVILAIGVVGGELYFRYLVRLGMGADVPLSRELVTLPRRVGEWYGQDRPIAPDVLMKIGAMDTLRRTYTATRGDHEVVIDLYIAYFGGVRGTAPHNPEVCMPGAGWDILDSESVALRIPGLGDAVEVHKDVFELISDQRKRLVVWWEFIRGGNMANRSLQRLQWALPGFLGGKRGSVLQVQVALEFRGDTAAYMTMAEDFITRLGPELGQVLPADSAEEGQESRK